MSRIIQDDPAPLPHVCYLGMRMTWVSVESLAATIEKQRTGSGKTSKARVTGKMVHQAMKELNK